MADEENSPAATPSLFGGIMGTASTRVEEDANQIEEPLLNCQDVSTTDDSFQPAEKKRSMFGGFYWT